MTTSSPLTSKKSMKSSFKLAAAVTVALGSLLPSMAAHSLTPVHDYPLYTYLSGVTPGAPGGVTATLSTINERLGRITSFNDQLLDNQDVYERQRLYEEGLRDTMEENFRRPSSRAVSCARVTSGMGRGGAMRSGAVTSGVVQARLLTRYTGDFSAPEAITDRVIDRERFCSKEDRELKRPGCRGATAKSSGGTSRPNADLFPSTLMDGGKSIATDGGIQLTNQTLENEEQVFNAISYVKNILPTPVAPPSGLTRGTQSADIFFIRQQAYNARIGSISDAFARSIGFSAAMGLTVKNAEGETITTPISPYQQEFKSVWGDSESKWEELFGDTFPTVPSERDLLRFTIFKNYASTSSLVDNEGLTGDDAVKVQVEMAALNNRLLWALLEEMEKQTRILGVIASHMIEPIEEAQLRQLATSASSQQAKR